LYVDVSLDDLGNVPSRKFATVEFCNAETAEGEGSLQPNLQNVRVEVIQYGR